MQLRVAAAALAAALAAAAAAALPRAAPVQAVRWGGASLPELGQRKVPGCHPAPLPGLLLRGQQSMLRTRLGRRLLQRRSKERPVRSPA